MASTSPISFASQSFLQNKCLKNFDTRARSPYMVSIRKTIKCSESAQWLSTLETTSNSQAKAFDASMVGVKGLADSGLKKISPFFIHEDLKNENKSSNSSKKSQVPLIDIGVDGASQDPNTRAEIIAKISNACEKWGFFQIVNHGIPMDVMNKMIQNTIEFHEQDPEIKKSYYTRDTSKRVIYTSNLFMYDTTAATWKDTLLCKMAPAQPDWEELPEICRDVMNEYADHVTKLIHTLFELLSEALGLEKDYLRDTCCTEGLYFKGHYSPPCPQPELTLSTVTHTDSGFLTILLQNEIEALQVIYENEYIDVPYVSGSLVINVGDIFQANI